MPSVSEIYFPAGLPAVCWCLWQGALPGYRLGELVENDSRTRDCPQVGVCKPAALGIKCPHPPAKGAGHPAETGMRQKI